MKIRLMVAMLLVTITACSGQKKILKQAIAFEQAGRYEEAADKYMEALYQNATRPESIRGLKRNAQKVVDQKLSDYYLARNTGDLETALENFDEVKVLQERLKYFKLSATVPGHYYQDYESDKEQYISILKEKAVDELTKGNPVSTNEIFAKIRKYDPDFNEKKDLDQATLLDRLYQQAVQNFQHKRWIQAWDLFEQISQSDPVYKGTKDYQRKIRDQATTLAIVTNENNQFSTTNALVSGLTAEVTSLDNPLIRVIDRENLDQVIEEQKLGLSGIIDETSVAELGKILGAKAIMIIMVISYNYVEDQPVVSNQTAYTASRDFVSDPVAQINDYVTNFHPATYRDYQHKSLLQTSFQYKLISTETAEILTADVVRENFTDNVHYATFDGDYRKLYPSDGTSIFTAGPEREAFLKLFTASRQSLTKKEMEFELQKKVAEKIAYSLDKYFRK